MDVEIPSMKLSINALHTMADIPASMFIQDIQQAEHQDDHLQKLKTNIIEA